MSIVAQNIEKILNDLRTLISANIDNTGKRATGQTQKRLRVDVVETENVIIGRLFAPDYIGNLEWGTPPKQGYNFQDVNDLAYKLDDWATAKGIDLGNGQVSFLFNTARMILKDGSKQYRNGEFTNIFTEEYNLLEQNITSILAKSIINDSSN